MKILVTGADGQLGRELRGVLEDAMPGCTVYADVDTLDITDGEAVGRFVKKGGFTHIVNCAAYTAVDRAESEKALCHAVNVDGVVNLGKAAETADAKMVHISTDYVFDGEASRPYTEASQPNPLNQYGIGKRQSETSLLAVAPGSVIIRTGWLYSPFGHNFVKTVMDRGRRGEPLRVVVDQVGTPTYALDLARAVLAVLTAKRWVPGLFHYSDMGVASWYDFAQAVLEYAGMEDTPLEAAYTDEVRRDAARPAFAVLDKKLIRETYGVEVPHWRKSLKHCIKRLEDGRA